ncbi:MAG: PH domain-containing protein [Bacilli bacterium]
MNTRNKTENILLEGEKVLYTFKPYIAPQIITTILMWLVFSSFIWVFILGVPNDEFFKPFMIMPYGMVAVVTLFFLILLVAQILGHRNRFYTVTNKRFIIQKGFLGIDYASVALADVDFMAVNVTVFDKILRKGTGSITFGTKSAPVTPKQSGSFMFTCIPNVYENYKLFKKLSDESKETVKRS